MSAGDMPKMYEQTGFLDTNTTAEGSIPQNDIFSQTLPDLSSPPHMVAAANPTNSNDSLEENLRLSLDELSYHHHNPPQTQDVSIFENGVSSTSMDTANPQHLSLDIGISYYNNNNNAKGAPLVQEESSWDSALHELLDVGFSNQNEHQQPHDQQFRITEAQNCSQSYNPSSTLEPSYPSPDLLHFLHQPRSSASSFPTNQAPCITNPIQNNIPNFQHSMGFLGDLPVGSNNNTSASPVLYDPLLHWNPALGDQLFQSLPHGYAVPTNSRSGFLFGGGDEMEGNGAVYQEGDGSQLDIGMLEFNRVTASVVGKGRKGKGTKQMPIDKQRRGQLNDNYQILRSLIPSPTKVDRASVVADAIDYIRELIRTVNELKSLVEKKRYARERCKRHKTEDDAAESCNMKPIGDRDGCIRASWLQRKSKDSEVDVRIIDDEVTIKMVQRKKINCMLFVPKVLDELQLDLHHVAGGHAGEYCSFLFNSKIIEGSSVYASAIANRVIEVMDTLYAAAVPHTGSY